MATTDRPALAPAYSSAKQAVLLYLKRHPGASLGEVADGLGISKAGVLGHLPVLESDGLVERAYRPGGVGRPRAVFRLTHRAKELFPQGYREMTLAALEFVAQRLGDRGVAEFLQQRAHEIADKHRARLADGALGDRVEELARIRTDGGYMAEVGGRARGGIELVEHNCPILALAGRFPIACETERRMFEEMLRARVDVTHRVVAGDAVCRFRIREAGRRA
ncbi:MAG TPA: metalloregulator ArsR/SmtB family transcription factor [Thermoplasmata archaeon]|nr:metalloregulator ArsR/SmtB family transcription factor [Thermoplasmata archaeon]